MRQSDGSPLHPVVLDEPAIKSVAAGQPLNLSEFFIIWRNFLSLVGFHPDQAYLMHRTPLDRFCRGRPDKSKRQAIGGRKATGPCLMDSRAAEGAGSPFFVLS